MQDPFVRRLGWRIRRSRRKALAIKLLRYIAKTPQTLAFTLGFALLASLLLGYAWRELRRNVLIVDPVSVPKQFEEAGLTSQVMAKRMRDELQRIESEAKTSIEKDQPAVAQEIAIPEVEMPGTKLGLAPLVDIMRTVFGVRPKHVGGDVVLASDSGHGITKEPANTRVSLSAYSLNESGFSRSVQQRADDQDVAALVHKFAELALREANPDVLAAYLLDTNQFFLDDRQFGGVEEIAEAVITDSSQDVHHRAYAYLLWGYALENRGESLGAISRHRMAVDLDGKFGCAYKTLGDELNLNRDYDEASKNYAKAVEFDCRDNVVVYDHWGSALKDTGKYDEAIEKYKRAVKLDSKYVPAYRNWAIALRALGREKEAAAKSAEADRNESH